VATLRAAAWRGRYFIAYAMTVGAALVPLLLGKMDGATYANALVWLFGALAGGGAAADATKRRVRGGAHDARTDDAS
jgi:hypothetical protein